MKFYIIDAFTENLFGGNPAGVVILDDGAAFPSDQTMVQTAAELRYSETAFIKQTSEKEFIIRYFTPVAEVDLCGHATIGSFVALLAEGRISENGEYNNNTLAGKLNIKLQNGFIMMDMASPQFIAKIDTKEAIERLYSTMGLTYEPIIAQSSCSEYTSLLPTIISTGLPDIILPVANRQQLTAISPDFPALSKLSEEYGVVGVHAFTLDCDTPKVTAHCRNFAPLYDIDEEAATGTANGALTYYLFLSGLISNGSNTDGRECLFIQGESMARPSKIYSHISPIVEPSKIPDAAVAEGLSNVRIQVGGTGVILATGDIHI